MSDSFRSPDFFPLMFLNFLFVFRFHAKLFELFRERVLVASHASTHAPSSSSATFPGVAHDVHYYYMILLLKRLLKTKRY
jgi:hypothetical protein